MLDNLFTVGLLVIVLCVFGGGLNISLFQEKLIFFRAAKRNNYLFILGTCAGITWSSAIALIKILMG